jgi:hypothetical protein
VFYERDRAPFASARGNRRQIGQDWALAFGGNPRLPDFPKWAESVVKKWLTFVLTLYISKVSIEQMYGLAEQKRQDTVHVKYMDTGRIELPTSRKLRGAKRARYHCAKCPFMPNSVRPGQ